MITARSILLISFFILPNSAISETLCLSDEKVAFTCNIKVRIASLCASTIVDPDKGNIQYRFGTRSNIEFQFPSVPSGQGREFHLSLATYGGGGETHIRFRNGSFEYIIYEKTTKGEKDQEGIRPTLFNSGVVVRKGGKQIANYRCNAAENAGISSFVYNFFPLESFEQLQLSVVGKLRM
jgi:hypothetical protein